MIVWGSTK